VDVALHQSAERLEHQAVTLDPALAGKGGRHDRQPEVALAFRARAGVAGMARRFVDQIEADRRQGGGQAVAYGSGDSHGVSPVAEDRTRGAGERDEARKPEPVRARPACQKYTGACLAMRVMVAVFQKRIT